MYMYIYIYAYTCMYIHTCMYMYICIYIFIRTYLPVYVYFSKKLASYDDVHQIIKIITIRIQIKLRVVITECLISVLC